MISLVDITFIHEGATEPLFSDISVRFPGGWTGIVGANGAGKTTLMRIACGLLSPVSGTVEISGRAVYCPQRTDDPPERMEDFVRAEDGEGRRLRGSLGIEPDWASRWPTLSHGERKRAQIAVALWTAPDVLAIDEPTNHVDFEAANLIRKALMEFGGTGLLVSHDRHLLDSLCVRCVFVEPPSVTTRPGGYTAAAGQARLEADSDRRSLDIAKRATARIERERNRRLGEAALSDRRNTKRGIAARDHDAKERINLARLSGKDGKAGRLADQMEARLRRARVGMSTIHVTRTWNTGIWLDTEPSRRDTLISLAPGTIGLGPGRDLAFPALSIGPTDRIGITGPNGSGKSTLIRRLISETVLPPGRLTYLPQEIDAAASRKLIEQVRGLSRDELGRILTIVSRLGSRPPRLMDTTEPSPGEMRKILLALGIIGNPWLIVMDEPTNHLDLPAIECLEHALADCPCGLLLVSHDDVFLKRLARTRWDICDGRLLINEDPGA